MKFVRNWFDKAKPHFEKGGRYHMFKSVFGGIETFLFVPNHTAKSGSHIRDHIDLKRTMSVVLSATIPALLFGMYNIGYQHFLATGESAGFWQVFLFGFLKVLPVIIVSYVVGLGIEFAAAQIRGHEINEGYLVTGMLIPLILPINTPLWMTAISVAFSVIFCKEVFGGTGMNILNPALTARAFLFFAYPSHMSGVLPWVAVDGYSGATVLADLAAGREVSYSVADMFYGFIPGSIGETSTLAILLGAVILIWTGVGSWKIIASTVLGGLLMGFIFNIFALNSYMEIPAWHHLILGGFAFGAVFMATDPVSGAQTSKGKWIYGFLIGLLAVLIRVVNPAYPEGMMLAILLMNVFAPTIDHYVVEGNIKRRLKRKTVK